MRPGTIHRTAAATYQWATRRRKLLLRSLLMGRVVFRATEIGKDRASTPQKKNVASSREAECGSAIFLCGTSSLTCSNHPPYMQETSCSAAVTLYYCWNNDSSFCLVCLLSSADDVQRFPGDIDPIARDPRLLSRVVLFITESSRGFITSFSKWPTWLN